MRGDYIDKFQHQWSKGLKRLITEGAWFRQADYPYYNTVTCAGHASISTGTVPAVHGMVLNQWWERNNSRLVSCTDDDSQMLVTYGIPVKGVGHSARHLVSTTLSDELRLQSPASARVVSISLKARSAISLGGHKPDAVIWLDEADGEWVTSTAFAKAPADFFADYIAKHPLRGEMGRRWERSLRADQYVGDYSSQDRRRIALVSSEFPHTVKGTGAEVGGAFTDAWESSPYSDEYLAALAHTALDALKLGRGPATDFLGVSFSALDKVGHDFGPDSHEVQDVLVHLDARLGALHIDARLFRQRVILVDAPADVGQLRVLLPPADHSLVSEVADQRGAERQHDVEEQDGDVGARQVHGVAHAVFRLPHHRALILHRGFQCGALVVADCRLRECGVARLLRPHQCDPFVG